MSALKLMPGVELVLSPFVDVLDSPVLEVEAALELDAEALVWPVEEPVVALVDDAVAVDDAAAVDVAVLMLPVLDVVVLVAGETVPGSSSVPAQANEHPALNNIANRVWEEPGLWPDGLREVRGSICIAAVRDAERFRLEFV